MPARSIAFLSAAIAICATGARAEIDVVASIKPVHSLVAAVMEGVGTPHLLIDGAGSPHTFAMRPSTARSIAGADVVFWVGGSLEPSLANALGNLAPEATRVEMIDTPGITVLPVRAGGAFDAHDHGAEDEGAHDDGHAHDDAHEDDHAHEHGDEHAEEAHDAHGDGEAHADEAHAHEHHDEDAEGGEHGDAHHGHSANHNELNPHIWLDPVNAQAMVAHIAAVLAEADPENAAAYATNAERRIGELEALEAEMAETLAPVEGRTFVVFHDAYPYLEQRFGVAAVGAITLSPEVMPGAAQLGEIRERIEALGATCVFAEPQFTSRLIDVVVDGTQARTGTLDPLGADIPAGRDQYDTLMRANAAALRSCLSPQS